MISERTAVTEADIRYRVALWATFVASLFLFLTGLAMIADTHFRDGCCNIVISIIAMMRMRNTDD